MAFNSIGSRWDRHANAWSSESFSVLSLQTGGIITKVGPGYRSEHLELTAPEPASTHLWYEQGGSKPHKVEWRDVPSSFNDSLPVKFWQEERKKQKLCDLLSVAKTGGIDRVLQSSSEREARSSRREILQALHKDYDRWRLSNLIFPVFIFRRSRPSRPATYTTLGPVQIQLVEPEWRFVRNGPDQPVQP